MVRIRAIPAGSGDEPPDEPTAPGPGTGPGMSQTVRQYLQDLSREELVALLERLAAQHTGVRRALAVQVERAHGPDAELLRYARATIDEISAESIYEGSAPGEDDLAVLGDHLQTLVKRGRADDVLVLCQRLLGRANRAVEAMDEADEDFFTNIQRILEVVPTALAGSTKPPVEQLLWLHELECSSDYDMLPDLGDFWAEERPAAVWSELADRIGQRLYPRGPDQAQPAGSLARDLGRDAWASLLVEALERAGRQDEVVPLLEREAEITASYQRLVTYVLDRGDLERAERWARRGIEAVGGQWPGIAGQLRDTLRTIRERRGDLSGAAALRAHAFLEQPSLSTFRELLAAAEVAGHGETVRRHALRFLETLRLPWSASDVPTEEPPAGPPDELPPWPLPPTGLAAPGRPQNEQPPLARVLLDIAMAEGRLADVLAWYDVLRESRRSGSFYGDVRPSVARAVETSHPDRAVAIWEELAAEAVARTNTNAYEDAARYLECSAQIEARRDNLVAWHGRVLDLRERERRKWRLRETLDGLLKRYPSSS